MSSENRDAECKNTLIPDEPTTDHYCQLDYTDTVSGSYGPAIEWASWVPTCPGRNGKLPFAKYHEHPALEYCDPNDPDDVDPRHSWSDPPNWADFGTVDRQVRMDPELVGRAFIMQREGDGYTWSNDPPADPYLFADGDNVVDPQTGEPISEYIAAIELLAGGEPTWQEISWSETGGHGMFRGRLPKGTKTKYIRLREEPIVGFDDPPMLELYEGPTVAVLTGDRIAGSPEEYAAVDPDGLRRLLAAGTDAHPNVFASAAERQHANAGEVYSDDGTSAAIDRKHIAPGLLINPEASPDDAPEDLPKCYKRALTARYVDTTVPGIGNHGTNLYAALLGVCAGYNVDECTEHFGTFPPDGDRAKFDAEYTNKELTRTVAKVENSYNAPSVRTLRQTGLFDESETCDDDCPIHGHDYDCIESTDGEDEGTLQTTETGTDRNTTRFAVTDQPPATVDICAPTLGDSAPSHWWAELVEQNIDEFIRAVLSFKKERSDAEYRLELEQNGVTALNGLYADVCLSVCRLNDGAHEDFKELTAALGSGQTPVDLRSIFEDILTGPLALLANVDQRPTISIRMDAGFFGLRTDHRRNYCRLLASLAKGCDVRLVTTGYQRRKLRNLHREDLPEFGTNSNPSQTLGPLADLVEDARQALKPDSTAVTALRHIADEPAQTLAYAELRALLPVGKSTVSTCISTLADLNLVEKFGPRTKQKIELTSVGTAFLDALDADSGRQAKLDSLFGTSGNSNDNKRIVPANPRIGELAGQSNLVQVRDLGRPATVGARATAVENGIGLAEHPVEKMNDGLTPLWWYDSDDDVLTVAADWHKAHQYMVCIARSLASTRTFDQILTPDRLDGEPGGLSGLVLDEPGLLRRARRLGWLKDRDANGEGFTERLTEAREHLLDLTRRLKQKRDAGEDCCDLYSLILREAHGLVGVMTHLLDLAGVEVVWQIQLPESSPGRDYGPTRRSQLATMLTTAVGICSKYGQIATYPHIAETRPEQRNSATKPTVDAKNPYAELIPSIAIVGPGVEHLTDDLEEAINGLEPHENAPEMAIRVPIQNRTRERGAYAQVTQRVCKTKGLQPTREAVSLLSALCGSPYDAASALYSLGSESKNPDRKIRAHDLRYALSTLETGRILSDLPRTVGKVTSTLLRVEGRVSQSELADLADVRARSIRNNRDFLETLDLLDVNNDGHRLVLSFADERRVDVLPGLVTANSVTLVDVVSDFLAITVSDGDSLGDPADPVGSCLDWPPDLARLCDRLPDVDPWVRTAARLLGTEITDSDSTVATLGPSIKQAPLPLAEEKEVAIP